MRNIQNDSSSGSSSPHSNTSHEEPVESSQDILQQKVVYNFSIPEFINHEPRIDREDRSCIESTRRKRNRTQRLQIQESLEGDNLIDSPVVIQRTKRRKRGVSVTDIEREDERDDDCHRRNVPLIDLTSVDSHDDFGTAHTVPEGTSNRQRTRDRSHPFAEIYSNLERRDRHSRIISRSPSLQRFQRIQQQQLRRRNDAFRQSSRHIITDGPRYTEDMLIRTPQPPELNRGMDSNDLDDSVMIVNEIRGTEQNDDDDFAIAQRMESDPTYSPPYFHASNYARSRLINNSSFQLIQERFRALRRRDLATRPHFAARIQHMTDLLWRDHPRNQNVTSGANHESERETTPHTNPDDVEREDVSAARMNASHNTQNESNDDDTDVEFIGELINNNNNHSLSYRNIHPPLLPLSLNTPPFPELFSDAFMTRVPTPPRLHHLYQENYEVLLNLTDHLGPAKPRGLEKAEIERIPSFRFSSNTAKETNIKCVVCISEYTNREKLRRLPCSHDFHAKCIDKWLKSNKTCPVCRNEVKPTE